MKWIVTVLGALALLVVVVAVIGMALPEDPMATASRSVQGTPEDGDIYNPIFRFMARFMFGYDGTMRTYLDGLEARMAGG